MLSAKSIIKVTSQDFKYNFEEVLDRNNKIRYTITYMKLQQKTQKEIDNIIKSIVITKEEGARGDTSKILFQSRYGKDWKKYYPASK